MIKKIFALIGILILINPVFAFDSSHSFFNFKEKLVLFFTFDENKKAQKMVDFATKRLDEINNSNDSSDQKQLLDEYQTYMENAQSIAQKNDAKDLKEHIIEEKSKHIATLENVYDKVPDEAKYKIEIQLGKSISEINNESNKSINPENAQKAKLIIEKRNLPRVEIGGIKKEDDVKSERDSKHEDVKHEDSTPPCIQMVQSARNSITGECKEFSTPCEIPDGWKYVKSCSVSHEERRNNVAPTVPSDSSSEKVSVNKGSSNVVSVTSIL